MAGLAALAGPAFAGLAADSVAFGPSVRAAFLETGAGARPAALGGAFTAAADDGSAIFWNPAGVAGANSVEAFASHHTPGIGISLEHAAVSVPVGPVVLGLGVAVLRFATIHRMTADWQPLGDDHPLDLAGIIACAGPGGSWSGWTVDWGAGVEVIRESAGGSSYGATAGLTALNAVGWELGAAVAHAGPTNEGAGLPLVARFGARVRPLSMVAVSADAVWRPRRNTAEGSAGAEWRVAGPLTLRAGYRRAGGNVDPGALAGLAAGGGLTLRHWRLDYAYQPVGALAAVHRVSITFGQPRDAGKDSADQKGRSFDAAYALYKAKDYSAALEAAERLIARNADHWRALQLAGNCRYALGDRAGAMRDWDASLAVHPDNPSLRAFVDAQSTPGR